jgi:hypothetical protein
VPGSLFPALLNRVCHRGDVQPDGADGVIVAGNDEVHTVRIAVGIDDAENRNAQLVGFLDGNVLVHHVHHEQRIRQAAHVLDAADAALELFQVALHGQRLALREQLEGTVLGLGLQVVQALDGLTDGLVVGEHPAQPALVHIRHAHPGSLLADGIRSGPLGADEQHLFTRRTRLCSSLSAALNAGTVFSRLMMWILFLAPKM